MGADRKSKLAVFGARLSSTVLLWAVVLGVFLSGNPWAFVGMVLFLTIGGAGELAYLFKAVPGKGCRNIALIVGVLMVGAVGLTFALSGGAHRPDFIWEMGGLALVILAGFCWRFRYGIDGRQGVDAVAHGILCYVYVPVLFGSFVLRLLFLPEGLNVPVPGAWLLLMMIASAKFTDMGAYATGSLIGKHKMAPKISPAKTWEGFAGAQLFAQAGAWGVWALAGESLAWLAPVHVFVLGLLMALSAVAGDLAESILKRSLEVKDSGKWLPGIGGVLDLIDSLCFATPVMYFYLLLMDLV